MLAFSVFDVFIILKDPIEWCLTAISNFFNSVPALNSIGPYGLAIVVVTLVLRLLLFPIYSWQLRTQRKVQEENRLVQPRIVELRKQYRKEPRKMAEEMQKVYAEHGVSQYGMLRGCLPTFIQLPILYSLYSAIRAGTQGLTAGKDFLWISDVSQSVRDLCCGLHDSAGHLIEKGGVPQYGNWDGLFTQPQLLIIPVIAAIATYMQSRMVMPPIHPDMTEQERTMAQTTRSLSFLFPVMVLVSGSLFPVGLAIYWAVNTSLMVAQQYHLVGWGSLNVPSWVPGAHRTTPLSYPKAPAEKVPGAPIKPTTSGKNGLPEMSGIAEATTPGTGRVPARAGAKKKKRR